ncbi:H-type lectin domain-containing protein [Palleronia sediminis]|nr:H-type lectin domain-containing protein [Palleronia sediminis]
MLFSHYANGGEMWVGEGPRAIRHPVTFTTPFRTPPAVHVGLSLWDMGAGSNIRVDIEPEDITGDGFTIVFKTWADSRIARMRAAWMAIGELPDPDLWDLD